MHRNRSSSKKRSRSPAVLPQSPTRQRDPLPSMDKVQLGGTLSEGQDLPSKAISDLKPSAKMPAFLRLSDSDQLEKFNELQELEKGRLESRKHDKSLEAEWALPNPDRILDRYTNISPWYKNRVKLQVPEGYSDYINASPIDLASLSRATDSTTAAQDKYICMQGPKEETIDHTWMMVWQSLSNPSKTSPAVIIMLTPTHVPVFPGAPARFGLQEKCYPYYPLDEHSEPLKINEPYQTISNENDEDSYHPLGENFKATVRFVSREETPQGEEIELRKLAMRVEGHDEEKIIYHFLYPGWPDFGAPEQEHLDSILSLMHLSRQKNSAPENPRIVHCSAGVGRSGTFVALEYLVGELDAGAWENIDDSKDPIFEAVNSLRTQRRTMVQSPEQYLFLYQAMKKLWERKYGVSEDTEMTEPAAKMARTVVDGSVFE